jgi:hypothetical protein
MSEKKPRVTSQCRPLNTSSISQEIRHVDSRFLSISQGLATLATVPSITPVSCIATGGRRVPLGAIPPRPDQRPGCRPSLSAKDLRLLQGCMNLRARYRPASRLSVTSTDASNAVRPSRLKMTMNCPNHGCNQRIPLQIGPSISRRTASLVAAGILSQARMTLCKTGSYSDKRSQPVPSECSTFAAYGVLDISQVPTAKGLELRSNAGSIPAASIRGSHGSRRTLSVLGR